jgi:hypothetical protein
MRPRTRFLVIGFVLGAMTVYAGQRAQDFARHSAKVATAPIRQSHMNEEFESIERRLRNPRDPDWNLTQDMQPCFRGSRLCFLLSGPGLERDR